MFDQQEQDDLRHLLGLVLQGITAYSSHYLLQDGGVRVGPEFAYICFKVPNNPDGSDEELAMESQARSDALRSVRQYDMAMGTTGSPFWPKAPIIEGGLLKAQYELNPNDVIGAEKCLRQLIVRFQKSAMQQEL